ncbi:MAG: hypothetical protein NTY38_12180 [Acidobacteria bacterium]|nr:hypothetical protein [Acidobacteriota bacterium]
MLRRREFLATGPGAALAARGAAAPPSTWTLKNLNTSMPLEERIHTIESFVHNRYYDENGLLYSHIDFKEERPHREEDLAGADPNNLGIPKHHLQNYENSAMNSGIFLAGQCYRYMVTGEPEALEFAAKAFRSIDINYQLSERAAGGPAILMQRAGSIDPNDSFAARPGWICKPYGGMLTTQTSSEQNFGPIMGLWAYRKLAPENIRARVDSMIVGVADLWREIGYKINFFGENWEFEKSMPRAQRHMPVWACVNRLAFEVSGERRFQNEFRRLDALFGAMPTAQQTNYGLGREKYVSTEDRAFHDKEVVVADLLTDLEPASRQRYLRAMTGWWKFAQIGMDQNFLSYYYIELNTVTGEWRPLPKSIKPRVQWNSPSMWQNGTFPIRSTEYAVRLSLTSAIIARRNPELAGRALELARAIFAKIDHERMHYMHDPENCLEPSLKYLTNLISGDALAYYPTAYWYGKLHKLW